MADPILLRAEDGIKTLLAGMTIAGGYNYDWNEATQRDAVRVTGWPYSFVDLLPGVQNLDEPDGAHGYAYHQLGQFKITLVGKLLTEGADPIEAINPILYKMLDDVLRVAGINPCIAEDAGVEHWQFTGAERIDFAAQDLFTPAALETFWTVRYSQDRINVTQRAV